GFGVIVYDSEGRVVDDRVGIFVCGAVICVEARALLAAVELAARYGERTLIFSDCQTLTNALNDQPDQWPWEAAAIVASITQILSNHWEISMTHVGRSEVHEANRLVKRARDEDLSNFWLLV
ncbi:hypothetical protein LINPERHAP2_LOCUS176, partial [Linum perenne]